VYPLLFVPLWIVVLLAERFSKRTTTLEEEVPPVEVGGKHPATAEKEVSATRLVFYGFLVIVAGMACFLGFDVIDQARGPGSGIALLAGYVMVAGGAAVAIFSLIGLASKMRSFR
jgi:hypothetical protein